MAYSTFAALPGLAASEKYASASAIGAVVEFKGEVLQETFRTLGFLYPPLFHCLMSVSPHLNPPKNLRKRIGP